MKQCLFCVACLFSVCGLFGGVSSDNVAEEAVLCDTPLAKGQRFIQKKHDHRQGPRGKRGRRGPHGDRGKRGRRGPQGAQGSFSPAFGEAYFLQTQEESEVMLPREVESYPFLVPLDTPAVGSTNIEFNAGTSAFTILASGTYSVEYFIKVIGFMFPVDVSTYTGQLGIAINVNGTIVGKAKIAPCAAATGILEPGESPPFNTVMAGSQEIILQLSAGDVVSLNVFEVPVDTINNIPIVMYLGSIGGAPDTLSYLKLQKLG